MMMSNPWLFIPFEEYEGHMASADVQQLAALSELFKRAIDCCVPESLGVLGVAGGNGLEQIDCATTKRIVGVDINPAYLDKVQERFGALPGLELHCLDLAEQDISLAPVALVHAALIFEHAGIGLALEHALSLVAPGGSLSVVLQLPGVDQHNVTSTCYTSMQTLKRHFALIDIHKFRAVLEQKGFRLVEQESRSLPAGKGLWFGIFAQSSTAECFTDATGKARNGAVLQDASRYEFHRRPEQRTGFGIGVGVGVGARSIETERDGLVIEDRACQTGKPAQRSPPKA
jgi:hypothetical protein